MNNGGRSQRALATETSLDVQRSLLELNVLGTISLTQAVIKHMHVRKDGMIVVVSSVAGKLGKYLTMLEITVRMTNCMNNRGFARTKLLNELLHKCLIKSFLFRHLCPSIFFALFQALPLN